MSQGKVRGEEGSVPQDITLPTAYNTHIFLLLLICYLPTNITSIYVRNGGKNLRTQRNLYVIYFKEQTLLLRKTMLI